MIVVKRDNTEVAYDTEKIAAAIAGAFLEVGKEELPLSVVENIENDIYDREVEAISVEEIQDIIEETLMALGYHEEARAYVRYRYLHELARQKHTDREILSMISGANEYWKGENSNKNPELVTVQRDYLAGITSTDIARKYIFPKDVIEAYDNGWVHQHDMDYMAQSTLHNCELINLRDMLQNGTVINNVRINKPHRKSKEFFCSMYSNYTNYGGSCIIFLWWANYFFSSFSAFCPR